MPHPPDDRPPPRHHRRNRSRRPPTRTPEEERHTSAPSPTPKTRTTPERHASCLVQTPRTGKRETMMMVDRRFDLIARTDWEPQSDGEWAAHELALELPSSQLVNPSRMPMQNAPPRPAEPRLLPPAGRRSELGVLPRHAAVGAARSGGDDLRRVQRRVLRCGGAARAGRREAARTPPAGAASVTVRRARWMRLSAPSAPARPCLSPHGQDRLAGARVFYAPVGPPSFQQDGPSWWRGIRRPRDSSRQVAGIQGGSPGHGSRARWDARRAP